MKELFKKYIKNKASKKEIEELFRMINSEQYDDELLEILRKEKKKQLKIIYLKKFIKYLFLIVFIIALIFLLYLIIK